MINNVDIGTAPDNGTGDSLRAGGAKINANFQYLDENKTEKGGYLGTAQDLKDLIDGLSAIDSAAVLAALGYTPENSANKGAASGYTPLGADSLVPSIYLPSYVEELVEGTYIDTTTFNDGGGTPVTPVTNKLYVDTTTSFVYRWGGSIFAQIQASPGTTDDVTEGSNLYFTEARVRATKLTGITFLDDLVLSAADSVLTAFGKLQTQVSNLKTSLTSKLETGGYTGTAKNLKDAIDNVAANGIEVPEENGLLPHSLDGGLEWKAAEGGSGSVTKQTTITINSTLDGSESIGLSKYTPIESETDLEIIINKGTHAVGQVHNFRKNGIGKVTFNRGENVRLEGKRNINNEHVLLNKGNFAALIWDRLDGSTLVGSIIGDIEGGYPGVVITSSYTDIGENSTSDVTVTGTGFSENMLVYVAGGATLNSWTFVNHNQITLNLTATTGSYTVTYDNGDITENILSIAASIVLLQDEFLGSTVDPGKWVKNNPDSSNLLISQNDRLLFTRQTDTDVFSDTVNYVATVNPYPKGGAVSILLEAITGFSSSDVLFRWWVDADNFVRLSTTPDTTLARLVIRFNGTSPYVFDTGVSINNRFKITYSSTNDIKFWYWNGASWTQLGTTQNYDLGASGQILLSASSRSGDAANDQFAFDELYITSQDYSTEIPS